MKMITWKMDFVHSQAQFKVRHMMVSNVTGELKQFETTLKTEGEDFSSAQATFKAALAHISTGVEKRDNHLKSDDFFDAANHPNITFESTGVTKTGENEYEMVGDITIRGIKKQIVLKVENLGIIPEGDGKKRAGFEITGKLSRKDFDLIYNPLLESGEFVVGDEVKLIAAIEMVQE